LSLAKSDYNSAEVQDNNNVLAKHIVKATEKWCSCFVNDYFSVEQPFRDVGMENFVNDLGM
jgi:hypothetical protein